MKKSMSRYPRRLILLLLCTSGSFFFGITTAQEVVKIDHVVIDAGHGGKDPGTLGKRTREKYITLSIALKLGELIRRNFNDVQVIYTRDSDRFIELHERADIANRNKADLFISIHANANEMKSLRGAETYVMGLHRSTANLEIAKLENASILMESDYSHNYGGFDPNSDESYITFSLYQNTNLELSMEFASTIQDQLKDRVGLHDRGVRQAGFLVLYKTTMPSVLVEVGYLSNQEEENFLISDKGQDYIASAIFRAFRSYKNKMENMSASSTPRIPSVAEPPGEGTHVASKERDIQREPSLPASDVVFKVQLVASPDKINVNSNRFLGLKGVQMYYHQGLYKYTYGSVSGLDEANTLLKQLRKKGFRDAFIVAFQNGQRITMVQAKTLLGIN